MDCCGICGERRRSDLVFSKVKDGWICSNCLRASALAIEIPDFSKRNKAIKSMALAEFKEKIEKADAVRAAEKAKREEAEKLKQIADDEHKARWEKRDSFPVTTVDLKRSYEIVGPVFSRLPTRDSSVLDTISSRLNTEKISNSVELTVHSLH